MSPSMHEFVSIDLMPLMAAVLSSVTAALLGNFLVLRRLSLMGDAISHSVLPGLVIAFLLTGTRNPLAMFVGAAAAGLATVLLVEAVKRYGRVEPGAAMGVVFSALFALGVLLIEQAAARQVDLDADCVLYGQLETLFWFPPADWGAMLSWSTLAEAPRQVTTLVGMTLLASLFVLGLFKELRIASFDPGLATSQGFSAGLMHTLLMVFVAAATVASFEAVGSILVIGMLVCPAATARLLTDRLVTQVWLSVAIAAGCCLAGYFAATALPQALGFGALNAAGMINVVLGGALTGAFVLAPRYGVAGKWIRNRRLGREIAVEDLLAALFRAEEIGARSTAWDNRPALRKAMRDGLVVSSDGTLRLSEDGRSRAGRVVRRHRLWETYLVQEAGMAPDHVHDVAERLEHTRIEPGAQGDTDPHGKRIPQ